MAYSSAADGGAAPGWSARALAIVGLCFAINMADGIDVTQFTGYTNQIRHDLFCPYINIEVEREIVAEDQDIKLMSINQ